MILLGGVAARRAGMLRGPQAPARLTLRPGTSAEIELRDGQRLDVVARRVGRSWVSLSSMGRPSAGYFLTAGMTGPAAFRLVRLWALWGRLPAAPAARELNPYANVSRKEA